MAVPRIRWWVPIVALLVGWCLACAALQHAPPAPVSGYSFVPSPDYYIWAEEVRACVLQLHAITASDTFKIERPTITVDSLVWVAVPTERADGMFLKPRRHKPPKLVYGFFRRDTMWLSAQFLNVKWLMAHEFMHPLVHKQAEENDDHGVPWGICEWS